MAQPSQPPPTRAGRLVASARFRRIAMWLAGVVGFVAVAGFLVAPPIVRWQAEKILTRELGRVTTIDKVAINPFAPSITVSGFNLREADGTQPFVTFDELYVRASYTSLFRFAPVIDALHLSKPHARIVRTAADRFNFSDIQDRFAVAPKADGPSKPARFALYNIEVLGGRVDVDDRVVARKHDAGRYRTRPAVRLESRVTSRRLCRTAVLCDSQWGANRGQGEVQTVHPDTRVGRQPRSARFRCRTAGRVLAGEVARHADIGQARPQSRCDVRAACRQGAHDRDRGPDQPEVGGGGFPDWRSRCCAWPRSPPSSPPSSRSLEI